MTIDIVLGASFGDEGKGRVVDWLCSNRGLQKEDSTIVVRFSGGQQAAHNVVTDSVSHIHSNFGSGTLKGVPTYWSEYCTFYPVSFLNELIVLDNKGITPLVYVHELCPLTTPFDIEYNISVENSRGKQRHGTCGMGVGSTVARHESFDNPYKIFVKDLKTYWVLKEKLNCLQKFYKDNGVTIHPDILKDYLQYCKDVLNHIRIVNQHSLYKILGNREHIIFEGSQGILLDREHGIFPHCTRSKTTAKNAIEILTHTIKNLKREFVNIYYVSRAYQTRHGEGPMQGEFENKPNWIKNPNETNVLGIQGEFRYAPYSLDMVDYSVRSNRADLKSNILYKEYHIITCLDQISEYHIINNNKLVSFSAENEFIKNVIATHISNSDRGEVKCLQKRNDEHTLLMKNRGKGIAL